MGGDAQNLGQAADPHHIGLQDIDQTFGNQLAKAVAGIFMLCRRPFQRRVRPLDLTVAVVIIGRQHLFPPMDVQRLGGFRQPDRIIDRQRHVAIDHQRIVGANGGAVGGQKGKILCHPLFSIKMAVRQRHLGPPEAQSLDRHRVGGGAVKTDLVPAFAADQIIDRLTPHFADQIPQRQIDGGNRHDRQPLAAIGQAGAVHLIPDQIDVAGILPHQKPCEMMADQPGRRGAARPGRHPHRAIFGLDLDHQRADGRYPPA